MIPRYTPSEFAEIWSSQARYQMWLEVELAACRAMEEAGLVPEGTESTIRSMNLVLDPLRIDELERTTRHDVIAFLSHIEELAGEPARWLHRGMTSSDVLDTGFALLLVKASDRLLALHDALLEVLARRAREHSRTLMVGRSHGMHAEPVTFGLVMAGHFAEVKRARARLARARDEIAVGKLSGAVGTYAHLDPSIEARALTSLHLTPETVSTQVVARDRHAAYFSALALGASAIERLATNVRHWQRTEVGEAQEYFSPGQKGSSAMPHKRNPILSENLCGLARIVRAAVVPAFENIALWHERDISHSSVERMIAPDATTTLGFMLGRAAGLIDKLVVREEQMRATFEKGGELVFSESVLLALVDGGLARQQAYVFVQRSAMRAFEGEGTFRGNLERDADVRKHLSEDDIARCFDLDHALRHIDAIIENALVGTPNSH